MDHIFINDKVLSIEEIQKLPDTLKLWYKSICTICGNEFQTRCKNKTSTCSRCKNSIAAKKMYEDNPNLAAERLKKRTETNLKKYGVKNVYQAESIKEKIKQTNFRKYGVENYAKTNECKEKTKSTCLKKYGVEHSFQSENNKVKSKETSLKKYGVESPMQSENVKKKVEETKLKRYGDMHFINKEKTMNTCLKKYGVTHHMKCPEMQNKGKKKYLYKGMQFDSSWELAFYIFCKDNNYNIVRSPCSLSYFYNGKEHSYIPDFKVNDELIEIKGLQFFEEKNSLKKMVNPYNHSLDDRYEAKRQCMVNNKVKIITDCTKYLNYVNSTYSPNYLNRFLRG